MEIYEGDRVVELTSIRRAIADQMSRSKHEAPHAWSMVEVDVTGLMALRDLLTKLRPSYGRQISLIGLP